MPGKKIKKLLNLWAANAIASGGVPPFMSKSKLYDAIDAIADGTAPWQLFTIKYTGPRPAKGRIPDWMDATYEVWYRDSLKLLKSMLQNPAFKGHFDTVPFDEVGKRHFNNLFSGDWVWQKASEILRHHPELAGPILVPTVAGSDKKTVSVMTGNNEYYPMYLSAGNLDNKTRRAHLDSVLPVAFLAIPKCERKADKDSRFLRFRRQLFHSSLAAILCPLRPSMTEGVILKCPDGHYQRVVFCIGPYIADYPEQVLVTCTVSTWCPKCFNHPENLDDRGFHLRTEEEINELLAQHDPRVVRYSHGIVTDVVLVTPDLLHQSIKGAFKDYYVDWIYLYLKHKNGELLASQIMDDIDRRISVVPSFPGLRRFPKGRRFKQWTGDDSKALMKVILPALEHWLPVEVIRCFSSLLEFCYLARQSVITKDDLGKMTSALEALHCDREIFLLPDVRDNFNLPRQHALMHYIDLSMASHIKAVKEPWRRSSRWKALGQLLVTNSLLTKLTVLRARLEAAGQLKGTIIDWAYHLLSGSSASGDDSSTSVDDGSDQDVDVAPHPIRSTAASHRATQAIEENEENDDGGPVDGARAMGTVKLARSPARKLTSSINTLAAYTGHPDLPHLVKVFVWDQFWAKARPGPMPRDFNPLKDCTKFQVFHLAVATFYAPSDYCGVGGMKTERIRCIPNWNGEGARRDYVFAEIDSESSSLDGFRGLTVLRAMLFSWFDCVTRNAPLFI
ncbi:hypothetical protein BDV98DRAFT_586400 [Pterulicium gracile]|uniref:Uncharacterized protein n=1 Tax=Pterulicium gracile TaxID=1884261 RepID=A0A5C3Q2U4_9AGAR|nr:hypothetical protein BDV98DRAFT_586400 [Pterula gracilis]